MARDYVKRSVECPCYSTFYKKTHDYAVAGAPPIWECSNCFRTTPRKRQPGRRTNTLRGLSTSIALREAWEPTNVALRALVDAGVCKSGVLLVHSSTWNYHLDRLADTKTPLSHTMIRVLIAGAQDDLAKAQAFVIEKQAAQQPA